MGNSINAIAYRLSYHKNWTPNLPPLGLADSFLPFHMTVLLETYLERFFSSRLFPFFVYSHFSFFRQSNGFPGLGIFLCSGIYQVLLKFLARKSYRVTPLSIFSRELFQSVPPVSLPLPLTPLYLSFLRNSSLSVFSSLCLFHLQPLFSFFQRPPSLHFFHLSGVPTASLLCRLLSLKLKSGRHRLIRLINSYAYHNFSALSKLGVLGIRLEGSGRFARTQKASAASAAKGTVPLSTISAAVSYFSSTVYLKYGACNLRIWLYISSKNPF